MRIFKALYLPPGVPYCKKVYEPWAVNTTINHHVPAGHSNGNQKLLVIIQNSNPFGSIYGNRVDLESWTKQDNGGPHLHLQNRDAEMKNIHNCAVVDTLK